MAFLEQSQVDAAGFGFAELVALNAAHPGKRRRLRHVRFGDEVQHVLGLDSFGDQIAARLARDRDEAGENAARLGVLDRAGTSSLSSLTKSRWSLLMISKPMCPLPMLSSAMRTPSARSSVARSTTADGILDQRSLISMTIWSGRRPAARTVATNSAGSKLGG